MSLCYREEKNGQRELALSFVCREASASPLECVLDIFTFKNGRNHAKTLAAIDTIVSMKNWSRF